MQMFSASFVLFKTIKYIYMNNALNEVILLTTLGQTSFEANSQGLETNDFIQSLNELYNSVVT